jgi:hypothetical protein
LHLPPSGIDAGTITVFKPKTLEEKAEAEQEKLNIAKWLKAGYSTEKIKELLNAALSAKNQKAREKAEDALRAKYPAKHLRPGETIWTQPSAGQEDWGDRPFPARRPIGNFAEMNSYDMLRSGVYRVRAAYDERPNPIELKIDREKNIKPDAWEVKVVTPWVKVESR